MSDLKECPHCHTDLNGDEIPEENRHYYGDKTHFSRLIGIEDDSYDGVSWWLCPDCKTVWNRFSGEINTEMKNEEWFKHHFA